MSRYLFNMIISKVVGPTQVLTSYTVSIGKGER